MRPGVVVKLLENFFGTSEEAPSKDEMIVFQQLKKHLLEEYITVDDYTTLVEDDAASDGEIDDDFCDDTLVGNEPMEVLPSVGSSCSSPPQKQFFLMDT